jgi:hypothetical protein
MTEPKSTALSAEEMRQRHARPHEPRGEHEALKYKISRAIAVAIQFKEFGHSDGEDFVMTGREADRLELACAEATEAVLKLLVEQDLIKINEDGSVNGVPRIIHKKAPPFVFDDE